MIVSPIVLFVYNRPRHTRQTIEALQRNELAEKCDLIIYSDGPKDNNSFSDVQAVRQYLRNMGGFNKVTVIEREYNWGLAANIIDGVTDVISRYGRVVVMEDDIVTSPSYLKFMNQALDFYEEKKKVWHVSGWNYPIATDGLGDAFFWRVMNCWGWATWADRWQQFEKNPDKLIASWDARKKKCFDLDGSGIFWPQVEANAQGKIDTWAIFWYATIFQNNGLCLNPVTSYVDNIGHDGSGMHCGNSGQAFPIQLNNRIRLNLESGFAESELAVNRIKTYYRSIKKPFVIRAINRMSRMLSDKKLLQ